MAYARIIRQNFFNAPTLSKYSIDEKYLLIGLACTADDYGRLWNKPANIKSIVFPADKDISEEWIKEVIEKFIKNEILCIYDANGISYIHFPLWFTVGWCLKQKIDNPQEFRDLPDCPMCLTKEMKLKKRETSRAIQSNKIQSNPKQKNKTKLPTKRDDLYNTLSTSYYMEHMVDKYPLVVGSHFTDTLDRYLNHIEKSKGWTKDHKRGFEVYVEGMQEKLSRD